MGRSWLSQANNVQDIGVNTHAIKFNAQNWQEREARAETKQMAVRRRDLPNTVRDPSFFGGRLHDSEVLSIVRDAQRITVELNDNAANEFAWVVSSMVGSADPPANPIRIALVFHEPNFVRAARHDPDGWLKWCDWEHLARTDEKASVIHIDDWFYEDSGALQWVANLWSPCHGRLSDDVFLMIDCHGAHVIDRRAADIERGFSPGARRLWEDVATGVGLEYPGHLWGVDAVDYLSERMAVRGLRTDDLVPTGMA